MSADRTALYGKVFQAMKGISKNIPTIVDGLDGITLTATRINDLEFKITIKDEKAPSVKSTMAKSALGEVVLDTTGLPAWVMKEHANFLKFAHKKHAVSSKYHMMIVRSQQGKKFRLVGMSTSRYKYPFLLQSVSDPKKFYKFSASAIKLILGLSAIGMNK